MRAWVKAALLALLPTAMALTVSLAIAVLVVPLAAEGSLTLAALVAGVALIATVAAAYVLNVRDIHDEICERDGR